MRRFGIFVMSLTAFGGAAQAQSGDALLKMGEEFDAMDRDALADQLARAKSCTAARDLDCADTAVRKAAKLAHTSAERSRVAAADQAIADELQAIRDEEAALARAEQAAREAEVAAREAEEEAARIAERQQYEAVMAQQQEAAPSLADGIREGFASAMAGKARIDAIHNNMLAGLQQRYAEREAATSAPAPDPYLSRQLADARASAAEARQRAERLRAQQASGGMRSAGSAGAPSSTGSLAPARSAAPTLSSAQQDQDRQLLALEQRNKAAAQQPSPSPASLPVYSWRPYRQEFTDSGAFLQTEGEARDEAAKARLRREALFDQAVAKYRAGKLGYQSWRVIRVEPMTCADEAPKDADRRWWRCRQRVDYQIVSTEKEDMGDTIYTYNY